MKKLINSRKVLFLLAGIFVSVFLLIYLNACPTVSRLSATPILFCEKEFTIISFTSDWSSQGCMPWDQFHTIRWTYKKDNGDWIEKEEIKLEPEGVEDNGTTADGSFEIYGSSGAYGFEEGDPCLKGFGDYIIKVEAKGEKDGYTGWGIVGEVNVTVWGVQSIKVRASDSESFSGSTKIAVGAKTTDLHYADVQIVLKNELSSGSSLDIPITLSGAEGDLDLNEKAVLTFGETSITGDDTSTVTFTNSTLNGTLRSSNVTKTCSISSCDKSANVIFKWADETTWESEDDYIEINSQSEETFTMELADSGIHDHKMKFYIEEVEYYNDEGDLEILTNTISEPNNAVDNWATFTNNSQRSDVDGKVTSVLNIADVPEIYSILMVVYDLSANDE